MPIIQGSPNIVSLESSQKIIEQMKKNVCQIQSDESQGTGFFCRIPFPDMNNMLTVLITNNHIINEELLYEDDAEILIYTENDKNTKKINLNNRIKYINNHYDITIIEIKEQDKIFDYLELDDNILENLLNNSHTNLNDSFADETVYLLQYPEGILSVSYGVVKNLHEDKKYIFTHMCSTKGGSAGSPVLNLNTNKVMGIHHSGISKKNIAQGTLLNEPIKDFIKHKLKKPEFTLKDFNKKYNLNIKDINVNKIDLRWKKLGNEGLVDLCKIKFNDLKELVLNNNNISDIKVFGKNIFQNLETLSLSDNKIDQNKDASLISNLKSKIDNCDI